MMLEQIHNHILDELRTDTKTDRVFILTSIVLNFITLGVNSAISLSETTAGYISFALFLILAGIVNYVVIQGLNQGKTNRKILLSGLIKMYHDQKIAEYYDPILLKGYEKRYNLFIMAVLATGVLAFAIPLVLLIFE